MRAPIGSWSTGSALNRKLRFSSHGSYLQQQHTRDINRSQQAKQMASGRFTAMSGEGLASYRDIPTRNSNGPSTCGFWYLLSKGPFGDRGALIRSRGLLRIRGSFRGWRQRTSELAGSSEVPTARPGGPCGSSRGLVRRRLFAVVSVVANITRGLPAFAGACSG